MPAVMAAEVALTLFSQDLKDQEQALLMTVQEEGRMKSLKDGEERALVLSLMSKSLLMPRLQKLAQA